MAVPSDPRQWTPRQRTAYLADALAELLDTAPTEQTVWAAPESVRRREEEAQRIAEQMDVVLRAGQQ